MQRFEKNKNQEEWIMVKIAVLGASGKEGSRILAEAKKRGHEVTAIVRNEKKAPAGVPVLIRDVYQLTTADIVDFDVLVDALGFWGEQITEFTPTTEHLLKIVKDTNVRLLVVGGASSLYVNKEHTKQLRETPDFPKAFYPLGTAMAKALELIRKSTGVNWTYLSPAAEFSPEFPNKGTYALAGEEFTTDEQGQSKISYDDYAVAFVDEIENNRFANQRISVRW